MIGAVGDDAQGRLMLDSLSPPAWTPPMWQCSTATRPAPR
jgi:hypothetical protein